MPIAITSSGHDENVLEQVATDGGYPVTHTGSVRNKIEQVAADAVAGDVPAVSDRNAIEWLAGEIGGAVCYALAEESPAVSALSALLGKAIGVASVTGREAAVVDRVIGKDDIFAAGTELKRIDWGKADYRRLEFSSEFFSYVFDGESNAESSATLYIFNEPASAIVSLGYGMAYVGEGGEAGGWMLSTQGATSNINQQLSQVKSDSIALAIGGDGRLRAYVNGAPVDIGDQKVFSANDDVFVVQGVGMFVSAGTTPESESVSLSCAVSVSQETDNNSYADGSVGWCE